MLGALLVQYGLFFAVAASSLSHARGDVTIEEHVFNASVTLIFAAVYALLAVLLRETYRAITARSWNRNPDMEVVYDDLRDLDPEVEMQDPSKEGRPQTPEFIVTGEPVVPTSGEDVRFFLEVYGYGLVMFIVYYSVDLVLLAPALSLLCGLLVLSARDALSLLRTSPALERRSAQ
jgi:hypothetical protein